MSPVTSYQQLIDEQARAAVKVAQADHSCWNKVVRRLPDGQGKVRAIAKWDGAIEYRDDITATLQDMFENGRSASEADLVRYRDALGVVLHENVHLLAGRGTSHGMACDAFQEDAVQVFDEGITEAYKQVALDAYIEELGLERIAPGISRVEAGGSYPQFVPAAQVLANAIGRRSELPGDEVLRRLAGVNAEDKFPVAAELVYESSELPRLVPTAARAEAVTRVANGMKESFGRIQDYSADDPSDIAMSALAGAAADRAATNEVRALTDHWATRQDLRKSLEAGLTGTTPLRPTGPASPTKSSTPSPDSPRPRLTRGDQKSYHPDRTDRTD